jgi:hypothetical protein
MPFDPFSFATVVAPWLYELAKKEHLCIKCGNWRLNCSKVSRCCEGAICDGCQSHWLIRRNGVPTCPSCGHEYD